MTNPINKLQLDKIKWMAQVAVFILLIFVLYSSVSASSNTDKIYKLSNSLRFSEGQNNLSVDSNLEKAAYLRAQDMFQKQYFDHFTSNGLSPWEAIKITGFDYSFAGENLAIGYQSEEKAFKAWVNSPSHFKNIIDPDYTSIGVAEVSGKMNGKDKTIIVQLFATQKSETKGVKSIIENDSVKTIINWIKSVF